MPLILPIYNLKSPFYDKAYIFCSAPTVSNHYLFWKMIIEEEIENIVLFASTDDIKNVCIL